jgi:demethylmenaquinone methyltransferase/2-methoxy-6-polyprenyl-1,4-benzoquinol methylase
MTRQSNGPPSPQEPLSIAAMFGRIAHRYDLLNTLLSLGFDRRWRERAAQLAALQSGDQALDVCTGTGDLALALARRVGPEGRVVGVDFSAAMLAMGRRKVARHPEGHRVLLHPGDALRLPYADGTFDAAASSFAGRNVADLKRFFSEMARVVRPGGRVVFLELGEPESGGLGLLYHWYFHRLAPIVGALVSGEREDYRYLPQSVEAFASPEAIMRLMEKAGLRDVRYVALMRGIASVWGGKQPRQQPVSPRASSRSRRRSHKRRC